MNVHISFPLRLSFCLHQPYLIVSVGERHVFSFQLSQHNHFCSQLPARAAFILKSSLDNNHSDGSVLVWVQNLWMWGAPQESRVVTKKGIIMAQCFICRMFSFPNGHHQIYLPIMSKLSGKSPVPPEIFSSNCVVEKEAATLSLQTMTGSLSNWLEWIIQETWQVWILALWHCARVGFDSVSSRQGHLREFNHTFWLLMYSFLH